MHDETTENDYAALLDEYEKKARQAGEFFNSLFYNSHSAMLVIDPDTCIDCELCVTECPVNAIYPEDELPEVYREWLEKSRDLVDPDRNVAEKRDPHPEARTLEEIQAEERAKGWGVEEPTKAE